MGNNLEGPGTQLADVKLVYWVEPIFYVFVNGALTAACGRSLKNELKDPRSQAIINMKKLVIATGTTIVVLNILKLPPIYIEPHMWQVEESIHYANSLSLSTTIIHFNWMAVCADYTTNLIQDVEGMQRFTMDSVKLAIAANIVYLVESLGRVVTGKLNPWQKIGTVGWLIVLSAFARGMHSYYMIHKKCMLTLRNEICMRIRNSNLSSQADLVEVSKQNFDLSNVELTEGEAEQKAKLDKIRKKIFFLLLIIGPGFIMCIWNITSNGEWFNDETSWFNPSKPYNPTHDVTAVFITVAMAYWLWYFRVPQL